MQEVPHNKQQNILITKRIHFLSHRQSRTIAVQGGQGDVHRDRPAILADAGHKCHPIRSGQHIVQKIHVRSV